MANEQNLKPFTSDQNREEAAKNGKKGGIKSGEARRAAKRRGELWKELVNTEVTNEKMKANLRALGVTDEHPTFEQYIKATAMKDLMKNAKMQDVQRLDDELYGPLDHRQQIEVSGEVSGITINVKRYDKESNATGD